MRWKRKWIRWKKIKTLRKILVCPVKSFSKLSMTSRQKTQKLLIFNLNSERKKRKTDNWKRINKNCCLKRWRWPTKISSHRAETQIVSRWREKAWMRKTLRSFSLRDSTRISSRDSNLLAEFLIGKHLEMRSLLLQVMLILMRSKMKIHSLLMVNLPRSISTKENVSLLKFWIKFTSQKSIAKNMTICTVHLISPSSWNMKSCMIWFWLSSLPFKEFCKNLVMTLPWTPLVVEESLKTAKLTNMREWLLEDLWSVYLTKFRSKLLEQTSALKTSNQRYPIFTYSLKRE